MRRRPNPLKAKRSSVTRKASAPAGAGPPDPKTRVTEARKREAAAFEQQAATSEIFRVISRSPADVGIGISRALARLVAPTFALFPPGPAAGCSAGVAARSRGRAGRGRAESGWSSGRDRRAAWHGHLPGPVPVRGGKAGVEGPLGVEPIRQ